MSAVMRWRGPNKYKIFKMGEICKLILKKHKSHIGKSHD